MAAAAAFLERAVRLTPDPARRAERAVVAAGAKYAAGDFAATEKLLAAAEMGPLDQQGQARLERMRGQIQFGLQLTFLLNRGREAPLLLLQAAARLQPLDPVLALETLLEGLVIGMYAGRLAAGEAWPRWRRWRNPCRWGPSRRIRCCCCAGWRCGCSTAMLPRLRCSKKRCASTEPSRCSWMRCATRTA